MREEKVTIKVAVRPVAWQRSGGFGKRRFMAKESRMFRHAFQTLLIAEMVKRGPFTWPIFEDGADLEVSITAGPTRGDRDNVEKAILDACNGYLWADDKQVIDGPTRVYRKGEPSIEISVRRA